MSFEKSIATQTTTGTTADYDLICFSHLRWDFVYQRPQHLMSRFAKVRRVFFVEEPIFSGAATYLETSPREDNLFVVIPQISLADARAQNVNAIQQKLIGELFEKERIEHFVEWFYTPMALSFAPQRKALAIVYDCMDELSAFRFAPPELLENEARLLERADLVFTGGQSLFEAKKDKHPRVFAFPSSIDVKHFAQVRSISEAPADVRSIPRPRLGFCGVIDERMDIDLLREMADLRPDWQFVMLGPVVKISDEDLPRRANIHYLGGKNYQDLPAYLAGWDVALMPFAINESTRFISPTKTPEYLAAGKPVVSTPIRDVVTPYGVKDLVKIAETAKDFVAACEDCLNEDNRERQARADEFLSNFSWDKTWRQMADAIDETVAEKQPKNLEERGVSVE